MTVLIMIRGTVGTVLLAIGSLGMIVCKLIVYETMARVEMRMRMRMEEDRQGGRGVPHTAHHSPDARDEVYGFCLDAGIIVSRAEGWVGLRATKSD